MPNWHDDDCDCDACIADEDRFWREQGEGGEPWDATEALDPPDGMQPLLREVFGSDEDEDDEW